MIIKLDVLNKPMNYNVHKGLEPVTGSDVYVHFDNLKSGLQISPGRFGSCTGKI